MTHLYTDLLERKGGGATGQLKMFIMRENEGMK